MTRIRRAVPLLLGIAVTLAACEQQATETGEMEDTFADDTASAASAEAQLDSLRIRYEDAWNAGNMDAIGDMMTSEYREIGPEGAMDYDEAIAMMRDTANMPPEGATLSIETEVLEVAESGDVAYGSGVSTMTIPGTDGEEMSQSSQWVAGFKRVDGEWKIDRLAFAPQAEDGAIDTDPDMAEPETVEPVGEDTTGTM
jgi:ketosteroid isomerase-like protein